MNQIIEALLDQWPLLCAAASGFVIAFFLYLKTRLNYKAQLVNKDLENLKLQELIAKGSYIICPGCGKKIFLTDCSIYTGGINENENKTKSE